MVGRGQRVGQGQEESREAGVVGSTWPKEREEKEGAAKHGGA